MGEEGGGGRGGGQGERERGTCSGRGKINSGLGGGTAGHGSPPCRVVLGQRRNAPARGAGQKVSFVFDL